MSLHFWKCYFLRFKIKLFWCFGLETYIFEVLTYGVLPLFCLCIEQSTEPNAHPLLATVSDHSLHVDCTHLPVQIEGVLFVQSPLDPLLNILIGTGDSEHEYVTIERKDSKSANTGCWWGGGKGISGVWRRGEVGVVPVFGAEGGGGCWGMPGGDGRSGRF